MEIISLVNYLYFLGKRLLPASVMSSGIGQNLVINRLFSSAGRLWGPVLPVRELGSCCYCCRVEYSMLTAEDRITVWNSPNASSILSTLLPGRAGCVHPSGETNRGWFLISSQLGTIYIWYCPRSLESAALCSHSRLVPNSPPHSLKGPGKAFPSEN